MTDQADSLAVPISRISRVLTSLLDWNYVRRDTVTISTKSHHKSILTSARLLTLNVYIYRTEHVYFNSLMN